jgi:hypothetical protein
MDFLIAETFWSRADSVTKVLVNLSILGAAAAALVKLKVLNILAHRYTSELVCQHHPLPDGQIVFEADYVVRNSGDRPINLGTVTLQLCAATREGVLLMPDRTQVLAERVCAVSDHDKRGLFRIEAASSRSDASSLILTLSSSCSVRSPGPASVRRHRMWACTWLR